MTVWMAQWKWPDEEEWESSLHESEAGAFRSLEEEVNSFLDLDETGFSFEPAEYGDLLAGVDIGIPGGGSDGVDWLMVGIRQRMVLP